MRLDGFAVVTHFAGRLTLRLLCNWLGKSLDPFIRSLISFINKRAECGRFGEAVRRLGI